MSCNYQIPIKKTDFLIFKKPEKENTSCFWNDLYEWPQQKYLRNNFWPNISKDFKRGTGKIVRTENYTYKIWFSNEGKNQLANQHGSTCHVSSLPFILWAQWSSIFPGLGSSFLKPIFNVMFLIISCSPRLNLSLLLMAPTVLFQNILWHKSITP